MMRYVKVGLVLLCCLMSAGCATQAGMREQFEKSMKGFNRMLRWQEAETAGMTYMEPELREAFLKSAESIRRKGVTITDYRILSSECIPDKRTGEVLAEFDYYILPSNRVKTLTYRQQWSYHEGNDKKGWRLKNGLPEFE